MTASSELLKPETINHILAPNDLKWYNSTKCKISSLDITTDIFGNIISYTDYIEQLAN